MLAAAADAGALGVEVRYTTYTPEQTEIAQALAARRAAETQQAAGAAAQNTDAFTADDAPAADSDHKQ